MAPQSRVPDGGGRPLLVAQGRGVRRRIITVVAGGRLRSRQIDGIVGAVAANPVEAGLRP